MKAKCHSNVQISKKIRKINAIGKKRKVKAKGIGEGKEARKKAKSGPSN